MIKLICDMCGEEIGRNFVSQRMNIELGKFTVEMVVTYDRTANAGEICRKCLLKVINEGKDKEIKIKEV